MEQLGSGFYLPCMILEIRGAGEVLVNHKAAKCRKSDFSLYADMLNSAILHCVRDTSQI